MATEAEARAQTGFYCSTSGTYFNDKESLAEHYKSDFHRYNLKRKVAGLPPVTKEWFDARKAQLSTTAAAGPAVTKIWFDPLTRKKFMSENTYQAHVRSKKYQDLLRKSGQDQPPQPVIMLRQAGQPDKEEGAATAAANGAAPSAAVQQGAPQGFKIMAPPGGLPGGLAGAGKAGKAAADAPQGSGAEAEEDGEEDGSSGWETASDEDMAEAGEQPDYDSWDVCRSLFDNHVSSSLDANLEYMYRKYGFYLPDAEYLKDPEGLVKYLGAKLQYGHVPLGTRGDDPNAKTFRSLHAVQRHMVDSGACRMAYEGNEEEYADFYDYGEEDDNESTSMALVLGDGTATTSTGGFELIIPGAGGSGGKVLGTREFARYYRQRHRLEDTRQAVVVNTMLAKYRSLGIETAQACSAAELELRRQAHRQAKKDNRMQMLTLMRGNIIKNLPKNVPY